MLALEKKLINCVFLLKCDGNGKGQIAVAAFAVVRLLRELDKGECIKITYVQNASALSACVIHRADFCSNATFQIQHRRSERDGTPAS